MDRAGNTLQGLLSLAEELENMGRREEAEKMHEIYSRTARVLQDSNVASRFRTTMGVLMARGLKWDNEGIQLVQRALGIEPSGELDQATKKALDETSDMRLAVRVRDIG